MRPASLAQQGAARDTTDDDVPVARVGAGPADADGQRQDDASDDPPSALQLAAAPGAAAPVDVSPAAAALAQTHGAAITDQLAAQIASRAGAVRSSFDFSLDPQGLGRVDVSLKIDPQGGLSAVISFDNPAVAAEARSRAGDLHQALQQAGFDVSQTGLSFTTGGQGQGAAFQGAQPLYAGHGPGPADNPPDLTAIAATLAAASANGGIDITI